MNKDRPLLRAMISSTSLDLSDHRREAKDACLRQNFFPLMMEHLPADPSSGLAVSLDLVDHADIYNSFSALVTVAYLQARKYLSLKPNSAVQ
jgi:uncharacterized protein DUF4062